MKFDVVVGNPPYQELNVGENNQAVPMYHRFYELAEKCSDKYILITPARFLANQGATPKAWNKKMLSDKHISIKYFNSKSDEVFPNTEIKGGVVVLLRLNHCEISTIKLDKKAVHIFQKLFLVLIVIDLIIIFSLKIQI